MNRENKRNYTTLSVKKTLYTRLIRLLSDNRSKIEVANDERKPTMGGLIRLLADSFEKTHKKRVKMKKAETVELAELAVGNQ